MFPLVALPAGEGPASGTGVTPSPGEAAATGCQLPAKPARPGRVLQRDGGHRGKGRHPGGWGHPGMGSAWRGHIAWGTVRAGRDTWQGGGHRGRGYSGCDTRERGDIWGGTEWGQRRGHRGGGGSPPPARGRVLPPAGRARQGHAPLRPRPHTVPLYEAVPSSETTPSFRPRPILTTPSFLNHTLLLGHAPLDHTSQRPLPPVRPRPRRFAVPVPVPVAVPGQVRGGRVGAEP